MEVVVWQRFQNPDLFLQTERFPEFSSNLKYTTCDTSTVIKSFFQGTEYNPTDSDSKCVGEYDAMLTRWSGIWTNVTSGSISPDFWIGVLQNATVAITATTEWTNYCEFGLLYTRLDNTIESYSGLTNAFYKGILNYSTLEMYFKDIKTQWEATTGDCSAMWVKIGQVFHILFDFTVTENYI